MAYGTKNGEAVIKLANDSSPLFGPRQSGRREDFQGRLT